MRSGVDDDHGQTLVDTPPSPHQSDTSGGYGVDTERKFADDVVSNSSRTGRRPGDTVDVRATALSRMPAANRYRLADDEFAAGDMIGEYRILDKIGSGGCSTVYAASTTGDGTEVAIKVLRAGLSSSRRQVMRFAQEVTAAQSIDHPCIVPIYERGTLADGRPYLIMELVEGDSLTQILHRRGRMSPREAVAVLAPVCEALTRAHAANIVHRDIKASNIMVLGPPEQPVVRLLDFGIAKLLSENTDEALRTSLGRVVGTPQSMAPEQILGHPVTGRTDIYALGVLLFRMLTGRYPYTSPDAQVVAQMHMTAPPPRTREFAPTSAAIDEVIARAMAKDPAHRFDSPRALMVAFEAALRSESSRLEVAVPAWAIFVDARLPADQELDDSLLDDLMLALDTAEQKLRKSDFRVPLQTSEAVLGVWLSHDEDTTLAEQKNRILELARRILEQLSTITARRIHFNISVHRDRALVQPGGAPRTIGGPIMDVGEWAPAAVHTGVFTSAHVDPGKASRA